MAQRYVGGKIYTRPPMEIAVSAAYARTHLPYVLLETWNAMAKSALPRRTRHGTACSVW